MIIINPSSLPSPPNEKHGNYVSSVIDAGRDGRKYLDRILLNVNKFLKKDGTLLFQHSNFANIEKSIQILKKEGFQLNTINYNYPLGKTSSKRINYFIDNLPANCHPIRKNNIWYQRISIFICKVL